jgi:shikimate dehydrogenase
MKYTALIGNPTGHSVSHTMYEELVKVAVPGLQYKHIKIDVTDEDLAKTINALRDLHFAGLNVTLPHKLSVIPLLDNIDEVVKELGAVNTIKFGNSTIGYNTDWIGIYKPVAALGCEIKKVTIFGSGGAARAAIYAAKRLGADKIYVHYRNEEDNIKTDSLKKQADTLGIELHAYDKVSKNIEMSDLIINATSAGMIGKDRLPFNLAKLAGLTVSDKVYFDAVFNPLETPLLRYFDKQGAHTIDGLWMMIYQGIEALEIWLDRKIEIEDSFLNNIHSLLTKELLNV